MKRRLSDPDVQRAIYGADSPPGLTMKSHHMNILENQGELSLPAIAAKKRRGFVKGNISLCTAMFIRAGYF